MPFGTYEKFRKWKLKNLAKHAAYLRAWRKNNPDRCLAFRQRFYKKNRTRILRKAKREWRKNIVANRRRRNRYYHSKREHFITYRRLPHVKQKSFAYALRYHAARPNLRSNLYKAWIKKNPASPSVRRVKAEGINCRRRRVRPE